MVESKCHPKICSRFSSGESHQTASRITRMSICSANQIVTNTCKILIWVKHNHLHIKPLSTTSSIVYSLSCRQRRAVSLLEAENCQALWPKCCAKTHNKLTNRLTISPWETPQTRKNSRCTRPRRCLCLRDLVRCSSRRLWCCHHRVLSSYKNSIMSQKYQF